MFCRNCGKEVSAQAVMCVACGCAPLSGAKFCQNCGSATEPAAAVCVKCGFALAKGPAAGQAKSKMAAGLLGIFLGWLGIHRFYLGYTGIGVIQLILALSGFLTCGVTSAAAGVWGLIEGILILTGSIKQDAAGNSLVD